VVIYRLTFDLLYVQQGLEEKLGEQKVLAVNREMGKDWLDSVKENVGGILSGFGKKD